MATTTDTWVGTQLRVTVHLRAKLARASVAGLLDGVEGMRVMGDTDAAQELVRYVAEVRPEVVLVDAGGTPGELQEAVTAIVAASPDSRVLVLAEVAENGYVEAALCGGATGFLLWDVTPEQLIDAIRSVGRGDAVLHPKAAAVAGARMRGEDTMRLTPRQMEIMTLLTGGLGNKQIARRLGIAVETVKTHLERIFQRLDVGSRTEAVAVAMRQGVL